MTRNVQLAGSDTTDLAGLEQLGPVDPEQQATLTITLRRKAELPADVLAGERSLSLAQLQRDYGADPDEAQRVRSALEAASLTVEQTHLGSRRMHVSGSLAALATTFGTELSRISVPDPWNDGARIVSRYRTGGLQVPEEIDGVVTGVFGLDTRIQARAHVRRAAGASADSGYAVPELATVYNFPDGDGTGQTVAILELGGGYTDKDLDDYFTKVNVPRPAVRAVGVDGGKNAPTGDPSSADGEVLLDIEIVGALVPKADIPVYFAPNTDQGFLNALTTAVHATPVPAAVSISWGGSEDTWTDQARKAFDAALADAAALGVVVTAASGDNGSGDGAQDGKEHADFPSSSPNAVGCGGTHLEANADGTVKSETVWKGEGGGATGGGVSGVFPLPDYQAKAGVGQRPGGGAGRGVPDVAANADPATGYQVLVDGQSTVIGGTSAVAPLMAALVARLAQQLGRRVGPVHPKMYAGAAAGQAAPGFRDITEGDNGAYHAGPGWDSCTGLGAPDGAKLLELLRG